MFHLQTLLLTEVSHDHLKKNPEHPLPLSALAGAIGIVESEARDVFRSGAEAAFRALDRKFAESPEFERAKSFTLNAFSAPLMLVAS